jgi:hypothetical protein
MAVPVKEPERWCPPYPHLGETYPIKISLPRLGRIIGHNTFDENHRMTEFALTAQITLADDWWDVVRIDTKHGEIHAHYKYRIRDYDTREVIFPIYCQNDVDRGYQHAETMLIACWDENVMRWRNGC